MVLEHWTDGSEPAEDTLYQLTGVCPLDLLLLFYLVLPGRYKTSQVVLSHELSDKANNQVLGLEVNLAEHVRTCCLLQ